jgi:hypothetical protein
MKRIFLFIAAISFCVMFFSCKDHKIDKDKYGNCTDAVQNQNEEGIDCGGVCAPCSSCDDGIKNNNETGIDCGGVCTSCTPPCTIPAATLDYTLFSSSSFSTDGSQSASSGYYSGVNDDISISLSGGVLIHIGIRFKEDFNPITFIPLNSTMIFKTLSYSTFNIYNDNEVKINYYDSFNNFSGSVEAGYLIYLTKISNTTVRIQFCNILGSNDKDRLSINTTAN